MGIRTRSDPRKTQRRVAYGAGSLILLIATTLAVAFPQTGPTARFVFPFGLGIVGMFTYGLYWVSSWKVHTLEDATETGGVLTVDVEKVIKAGLDLQKELHFSQIGVFYESIVQPQSRFERITETVEPLVRSLLVKSAYTFQDPPYAAGRRIAIPLFLQPRGAMIDGLSVTDSDGRRVSTLGRDATLVFEAGVLRMLVGLMGNAADSQYADQVEAKLIGALASSDPVSVNDINDILQRIAGLPARNGTDIIRVHLTQLVRRLWNKYPIMVTTQCEDSLYGEHLLRRRQRFTVEMRVDPSFFEQDLEGFSGFLVRTRDRIRRVLAIRPAIVGGFLRNADRGASYHIQIRGPEGSYLARQRIALAPRGATVDLRETQYALRSRLGQRVAHLYIRDGKGFSKRYFVCHFFERSPGSLGAATMSALGAAVLVVIGAVTSLGYGHLGRSSPDLVAVLLAFPGIASAWLGLEHSRGNYGGVLMARVSLLATVIIALTASAYYALGPVDLGSTLPFSARPGLAVWMILCGAALINVGACIGGSLLRANVESYFVKRQTPEMEMISVDND